MYRLIHEATSKSDDVARHSCRKKHCLLASWRTCKNLFYIWQEAKIEHFICFIQDDTRNKFKSELTLAIEIKESPRCSNNNLNAVIERLNLWFKCSATIDGECADTAVKGKFFHIFRYLDAEFARWNNDEHLRLTLIGKLSPIRIIRRDDAFDNGNTKGKSLSSTGLCLANHIAIGKCDRHNHLLDREGRCKSMLF